MTEIERIDAIADEAWKEWAQTHALDNSIPPTCFRSGFAQGYARGRADAWQLPEVALEDLKKPEMDGQAVRIHFEGSWRVGELIYDIEEQCCWIATTAHNKCISFDECQHVRGPLPLGDQA